MILFYRDNVKYRSRDCRGNALGIILLACAKLDV
jgi:hypothetical protein